PPALRGAEPPFVGETLRYAMSWKIFAGGIMTISVSDPIALEGRPAYKIELSAISNDFISNFFVVRDSITSWIDRATLQSLRYEKHSVEGKRVDDERIDFDLEEKVATRETGRRIPFDTPVFDSLSSVYYLRAQNLESGEPIELEVVSGKHAYRLQVDVLGIEEVKTPAGTFRARKVHPKMKEEGLLKKGGDLWIWFAEDARRTPVVIKSKLNFGTLTAKLESGLPVPEKGKDEKDRKPPE
ncbi:MAG TPA: DUF3108 domain-containing protein, partial [Thermoanaerobaculia bacterium]|nr:DUF3108 domain-containing protein [Thermoanaerobaculia bacterium]